MPRPILLIVEDEKSTREGLLEALEEQFDCYAAADLSGARDVLKSENIDLLLTDLRLGAENGMDLITELNQQPSPPVSIVMTAYGSVDTAVAAVKAGAFHFLTKPLNLDEVELLLLRAFRSQKIETDNQDLRQEVEELKKATKKEPQGLSRIIGTSTAIVKMKEILQQVAPTKATVLIEGESGTGKELVAHALHDLSGRPKDKLVIVNCAALPSQLLESELFGHEKGAFTDAKTQRIGRFEEATNGTLFLDEIGEIDASTQVKLLRALSEKTIQRVGSNKTITIDTRVIAATNKTLSDLVEDGEFREDLYFRLNVVKLATPPLRDRRTDIPILSSVLLKHIIKENGLSPRTLSPDALERLQSYYWPGNVRQLQSVLEHAAIMSPDSIIKEKSLPNELNTLAHTTQRKTQTEAEQPPEQRFILSEIEHKTIRAALDFTKGNRSKAAELLGISRRTLQRKLSDFSLS